MSDEHNYIITNPDMHTIDMEPFQYGGANITGIYYTYNFKYPRYYLLHFFDQASD